MEPNNTCVYSQKPQAHNLVVSNCGCEFAMARESRGARFVAAHGSASSIRDGFRDVRRDAAPGEFRRSARVRVRSRRPRGHESRRGTFNLPGVAIGGCFECMLKEAWPAHRASYRAGRRSGGDGCGDCVMRENGEERELIGESQGIPEREGGGSLAAYRPRRRQGLGRAGPIPSRRIRTLASGAGNAVR